MKDFRKQSKKSGQVFFGKTGAQRNKNVSGFLNFKCLCLFDEKRKLK